MIHDELLAIVSVSQAFLEEKEQFLLAKQMSALRAVVELHKDNGYGSCDICADPHTGHLGVMALYPCLTIQAIGEQLK